MLSWSVVYCLLFLLAVYSLLSVVRSLLSAACCLLSAVFFLLSAFLCWLSAVCCLLPAACLLAAVSVRSMLSAVCCLLLSVYCLVSGIWCLVSAVCCLLSLVRLSAATSLFLIPALMPSSVPLCSLPGASSAINFFYPSMLRVTRFSATKNTLLHCTSFVFSRPHNHSPVRLSLFSSIDLQFTCFTRTLAALHTFLKHTCLLFKHSYKYICHLGGGALS
jgi:hypothetical protein